MTGRLPPEVAHAVVGLAAQPFDVLHRYWLQLSRGGLLHPAARTLGPRALRADAAYRATRGGTPLDLAHLARARAVLQAEIEARVRARHAALIDLQRDAAVRAVGTAAWALWCRRGLLPQPSVRQRLATLLLLAPWQRALAEQRAPPSRSGTRHGESCRASNDSLRP